MKLIKTLTALSLAGALAASGMMTALAGGPADQNESDKQARLKDNVLEYDEIYDLIDTYNTTVQNNNRSYHSMTKEDLNTTVDYLLEKAEELEAIADELDSAYDSQINAGQYEGATDLLKQITATKLMAQQYKKQAQSSTTDTQAIKLQFDQAKYGLVMTTQNYMAQYNQTNNSLPGLYATRETLAGAYHAAQVQLNAGMCTAQDVIAAQKNLQDMENAIQSAEDGLKTMKSSLGQLAGWSAGSSPEVRGIPTADTAYTGSLDLQADIKKAIGNSISLRILRRNLNTAGTSSAEKNTRSEISDGEQKITIAVTQKYNSLLQKKAAYDSAKVAFELETASLNAAQTKYQQGSISALELKQQEAGFQTKEAEFKNADIDLFMAVEDYKWTVEKGMGGAQ